MPTHAGATGAIGPPVPATQQGAVTMVKELRLAGSSPQALTPQAPGAGGRHPCLEGSGSHACASPAPPASGEQRGGLAGWALQGQGLQPGARKREWPGPPFGPLQAGRPTRDEGGPASRAKKGQPCSGAGDTGENQGRATGSPTAATVSLLWAQEKEGSRWAFAASPSFSCTLLGSPGPLEWGRERPQC